MPKISEEQVESTKAQILNACQKLYAVKSFKEITIKDISALTTLTRTSVYNYFKTKEEIFLALLRCEYEKWTEELLKATEGKANLQRAEFAHILADTLKRRELLLKVLAMNMYDIEENSRIEKLVEFKTSFGACRVAVKQILCEKLSFTAEEAEEFIYAFFPFVLGIYPYANATEKQREAMRVAGVDYKETTVYDLALCGALRFLKT